jgi:uncharacterized protein (TIGR03437 family)
VHLRPILIGLLFLSTCGVLAASQELGVEAPGAPSTVSAASYAKAAGLAPGSIASTFGSDLATQTATADMQPLPTQLAGTTVSITDSKGAERPCPLFFVSAKQVNHLIPDDTAPGTATIRVTSGDGTVTTVSGVQIVLASAGIFTANSTGNGPAAGYAQRFQADGKVVTTPLAFYDPVLQRFVSQPVDLGGAGDQIYFTLFGTGLRGAPAKDYQAVLNGFHTYPVSYVGPQGEFVGLDQINIGPIPASDATNAFENGYGDITLSLFLLSGSLFTQSNQALFRIIHPDFVPFAELLPTDTVIRGQSVQQFTVWGDYLAPGGQVSIHPADGITMSNISVFDTAIRFDLTVEAGAAIGDRQLVVTTPYGVSSPALKLTIQDSSSPNPYLTDFAVGSSSIDFHFNSPGAHLTSGSLLNTYADEVDFASDNSLTCMNSYASNALVHPGQALGSVQYGFSPPLANQFFSRHFTYVRFSVTDAAGRQSNTVGTRVDDPTFGCFQMPASE